MTASGERNRIEGVIRNSTRTLAMHANNNRWSLDASASPGLGADDGPQAPPCTPQIQAQRMLRSSLHRLSRRSTRLHFACQVGLSLKMPCCDDKACKDSVHESIQCASLESDGSSKAKPHFQEASRLSPLVRESPMVWLRRSWSSPIVLDPKATGRSDHPSWVSSATWRRAFVRAIT